MKEENNIPDIVAQAEAETPAEATPAFPAETGTPQKSHKGRYILAAFLCLALIGVSTWYLLSRSKASSQTAIQNDIEPAPALEPIPASKLALKGNQLSDFDLAFLRLENKTENVIYSPLSIKYALAMLADGANGRSKEQITAVIGDYTPKAYLNSANRSLANAMFIRTDFASQVKDTYKTTLESKYNASVILDPFTSPDNANKWVEDKTLGIIKNTFTEATVNPELDYMLVNALAIDMRWKNQLQCAVSDWNDRNAEKTPNMGEYSVGYKHEEYRDFIGCAMERYADFNFNGKENTSAAKIGTSVNRYNIITELGESHIRETVQTEYNKWLAEIQSDEERMKHADTSFNLDNYITELSENYGKLTNSTDFYFSDTSAEKIFVKDLQEYDGSTLQYVGIMPKSGSLNAYLNNINAEKVSDLITNTKNASDINSYKDGVITKITGYIPFFKFDFTMGNFMENLESLGITDVFSSADADLSNMITFDTTLPSKPHINVAIHKADIDFSNDGIKAGAVTAFGGKGAAGYEYFEYKWDVPVEEIDLTFDKPFLFLIRDKATGEVWFTGTVYEGKAQE